MKNSIKSLVNQIRVFGDQPSKESYRLLNSREIISNNRIKKDEERGHLHPSEYKVAVMPDDMQEYFDEWSID